MINGPKKYFLKHAVTRQFWPAPRKKNITWILAGGAKKKHNTSRGAGAKIPAKTLGIGSRVSAKKIFGGRFYRVLVARQREKKLGVFLGYFKGFRASARKTKLDPNFCTASA